MHDEKTENEIIKIRRLLRFGVIAGPVSLLIGGVLLGTIGLICALIAKYKLTKLLAETSLDIAVVAQLQRSIRTGIIVCAVALTVNAVCLYMAMPLLTEMMESGSFTASTPGGDVALEVTSTWG